ncbi:hypothetical protein HID58_067342, partial [Brassica napus]
MICGQKIHASCKRTLMYRVQRDIQLGEWRELENCKISAAGGQYRPSKFQYKLTIIGDTKIKPTDYRDENQFLSLANVMGQVVDLGEVAICQLKTGENRKRVNFRLRDTSGNELVCCLWGPYAEQIESHVEESKDEPIVCLIRFAKISNFRGEVQITNAFDSSVLMLNPIMEEAIDFRQKMSQTDLPLALLGSSDENKVIKQVVDDWNEVDIKCISEIYLAVEPVFYCDVCRANTTDVSPKYKLHLFVKDDTGSCQLMLLDTVAKTIIGEKAETLWDGSYAEIEDPNILPIPIKNCVSEVWSGDHIHRIESLSEPVSLIETNSTTLSTGEVRLIDYNKESSSDVSTPFSKRKEGDAELSDMNSTSKKLRAQSIKISKEISYKENDNTGLKQQSLSRNQTIDQRNIQPSVAICSVFKRIFDDLDLRPISKYNYVREGQNISTPKTPTCKRRCVWIWCQTRIKIRLCKEALKIKAQQKIKHYTSVYSEGRKYQFSGTLLISVKHISVKLIMLKKVCVQGHRKLQVINVDMIAGVSLDSNQSTKTTEQRTKDQRSTETNTTHVPNKRKQRQNKISVGYDIPNIDQLHDDHIEDDPEEMNDCDVDIEGIIEEIDADLEFDVSSQETTDSENDDLGLDVSNANITYPFRQEVKRKTKPLRKSSI